MQSVIKKRVWYYYYCCCCFLRLRSVRFDSNKERFKKRCEIMCMVSSNHAMDGRHSSCCQRHRSEYFGISE